MSVLEDPEGDEWRPFKEILLSPDRVGELRAKYSKEYRRQIERRWSFGNICAILKQNAPPEFTRFGHMMYNFGTSSHIAHQDIVGIGMVWERNGRSDERRVAVELAHGGRLISDVCAMSWLRAYSYLRRCNMDVSILRPYYERTTELEIEMKAARAKFNELEFGI